MFDQYSIFLVAYEPRVVNGQSQHQYPHDPYCGQLLPNELEPEHCTRSGDETHCFLCMKMGTNKTLIYCLSFVATTKFT